MMKINVQVLGWTDICCGCNNKIPKTEKVYMISEIAGVTGSIHLCETCIDKISKSNFNRKNKINKLKGYRLEGHHPNYDEMTNEQLEKYISVTEKAFDDYFEE